MSKKSFLERSKKYSSFVLSILAFSFAKANENCYVGPRSLEKLKVPHEAEELIVVNADRVLDICNKKKLLKQFSLKEIGVFGGFKLHRHIFTASDSTQLIYVKEKRHLQFNVNGMLAVNKELGKEFKENFFSKTFEIPTSAVFDANKKDLAVTCQPPSCRGIIVPESAGDYKRSKISNSGRSVMGKFKAPAMLLVLRKNNEGVEIPELFINAGSNSIIVNDSSELNPLVRYSTQEKTFQCNWD